MSPRVPRFVLALAVVVAVVLSGCAAGSTSRPPAEIDGSSPDGGFRGDVLSRPVVLSSAVLRDRFRSSAGGTTTLGSLQRDRLMLLYFGYTHCPDVCPTTMADLEGALLQLPSVEQAHVQVVFVTSDPARDTPAVMKSWLTHFAAGLPRPFVGLTASVQQIDAVASSVGVPLEPPVKQRDGTISVEHGAQTLGFVNGKASVLWLAGTTPASYAHDLGRLVTRVGSQ